MTASWCLLHLWVLPTCLHRVGEQVAIGAIDGAAPPQELQLLSWLPQLQVLYT